MYIYISYLFVRCLKKSFEEERNENEKGKSRGVTTNYIQ